MAENSYTVEMKINNDDISLNPFLQNFYASTLLGSIQSLKDIPANIESLTIKILKKQ